MKHPIALLVFGVCAALLIPALFMDGMFMDGVIYATVSKNMANGIGTFWEPVFSDTLMHSYHEQPPLMFFLQGLFFKVLGTGFHTERIYCLSCAVMCCVMIFKIWNTVQRTTPSGLFAVFFYFVMPVTFYSFTNNVEECTMSVFVLLAAYFQIRVFFAGKPALQNLLISGVFILLAGLTKGVQGTFLLAGPFIWSVTAGSFSFRKVTAYSLLVITPLLLFLVYAVCNDAVAESFRRYYNDRLTPTFNNVMVTSGSRFHLLYELLLDTLPVLILAAVLMIRKARPVLSEEWKQNKPLFFYFLLTGLSGILPLMVTLEQRGFYLLTALPFIAMALTVLIKADLLKFEKKISASSGLSMFLRSAGIVLIAGTIVMTMLFYGKPKRDAEKLNNLKMIAEVTGEKSHLIFAGDLRNDWSLISYAARFYDISVENERSASANWMISENNFTADSSWVKVPLQGLSCTLYKKLP